MLKIKLAALLSGALMVSGCGEAVIAGLSGEGGQGRVKTDKTFDYGQGAEEEHLSNLVAGIWVDPNGCDHWIIDDGIEGYLSARLDRRTGKPVCSGVAAPTQTVGDFKGGATEIIGDPF